MENVIAIASGKGGTGKSLFTANLGSTLALAGKKVVLVDMDIGLRNLDLYLGLEDRVVYNVMDVLSGICRIKQALVRDKRFPHLYLMAASPQRDTRDITKLHMQVLCDKLLEVFDYVLIDAPAGIHDSFELAVSPADTVVVVTEADVAAIRDTQVVDSQLQALGIPRRFCVLNKVRGELIERGSVPSIAAVTNDLRMDMVGMIQYDDNLLISATKGMPLVLKENSYITRNFENIARRIVEDLA